MGRQRQPEIRQRLLDACTEHALADGLPDRLAPLAAAAGTSDRMLLYHFGSRDLLRAVLAHARQRQLETFGDLLHVRANEPYITTLGRAWTVMSGPHGQPYLRMFGQLRESTEQQLWPDFRGEATTDWLGPLDRRRPTAAGACRAAGRARQQRRCRRRVARAAHDRHAAGHAQDSWRPT